MHKYADAGDSAVEREHTRTYTSKYMHTYADAGGVAAVVREHTRTYTC